MPCRDRWEIRWTVCLAALLVIPIVGCHKGSIVGRDFKPVPQPWNAVDNSSPVPVPATPPYAPLQTYPLRVGDEITFSLSTNPQAAEGAYRMRVSDQLSVEYLHDPAADRRVRTMQVLPNGTVDLPLIGPVSVAGKTVEQVTLEANTLGKRYYKYPQIVVAVSEVSHRADELRRAFGGGSDNQGLTVVVNPDGTIDLPDLGTIHVFGRTLSAVREEVQQLYARAAPGVRIWPRLTKRAPDQVFVLGQVHNPGRFMIDRPTHVSQAIALAGGWLRGAELRSVVLIRYREGDPEAAPLDLSAVLQRENCPGEVDLTDDLILADGDVIVLPRDKAQTIEDHIRQVFCEGIYGVLPFPALHDQ